MHDYQRLIIAETAETYSEEEQEQLRVCLLAAPGVRIVKGIELHFRGGYCVWLERSEQENEAFFDYLVEKGYRPAF